MDCESTHGDEGDYFKGFTSGSEGETTHQNEPKLDDQRNFTVCKIEESLQQAGFTGHGCGETYYLNGIGAVENKVYRHRIAKCYLRRSIWYSFVIKLEEASKSIYRSNVIVRTCESAIKERRAKIMVREPYWVIMRPQRNDSNSVLIWAGKLSKSSRIENINPVLTEVAAPESDVLRFACSVRRILDYDNVHLLSEWLDVGEPRRPKSVFQL